MMRREVGCVREGRGDREVARSQDTVEPSGNTFERPLPSEKVIRFQII